MEWGKPRTGNSGRSKGDRVLGNWVHYLRRQGEKCMHPKLCTEGWVLGDTERRDGRWQKRKVL